MGTVYSVAMRDLIEQKLQDGSNNIWSTAELDDYMVDGLDELAEYVPNMVRETLTATAASPEIDISSITSLKSIVRVEYPISKDPRRYREFEVFDQYLIMSINFDPAASDSVYAYCNKPHTLTTIASTIPDDCERDYINLVAGIAAVAKSADYINQVNIGGRATKDMESWGQRMYDRAIKKLKNKKLREGTEVWQQYTRDR